MAMTRGKDCKNSQEKKAELFKLTTFYYNYPLLTFYSKYVLVTHVGSLSDGKHMQSKKILSSFFISLFFFSPSYAMEESKYQYVTEMKTAIVGGRNDISKELYCDNHPYFLIDYDEKAGADFTHDINDKIPQEFDQLGTFDRVIFENTHVNTFNAIAINNGLDLLKTGGTLSMSAFPHFCLISEERKDLYQYAPIRGDIFPIKVFEKDKKYDTLAFHLYKRLLGAKEEPEDKKHMWEFASLSSKTDDFLDLDDKEFTKEAKGSVSTGSVGSNDSNQYDITGRYIEYNSQDIIGQIKKLLEIANPYEVYFGSFDESTWVSKKSPSIDFGFFIRKVD